MSKYGPGLTIVQVCELELKEMKEILKKYNVSREDSEELTDMLKEAYFQFSKACTGGRVLERILEEETDYKMDLQHYMELETEEEKKYPFNIKE